MNSLDIFDSAFSLANLPITDTTNNVIESITDTTNNVIESIATVATEVSASSTTMTSTNNLSWLYIGIVFIFLAFAMYAYKSYTNKNRKQVQFDETTQDCPGGFCTMEKCI